MATTLGLIIGGLLLALLALIGILSAVKGTPVCTVQGPDREPPPAPGTEPFRIAMELASRVSMAPGHTVEVFANGDSTYPPLWNDLRAARDTITLQMYYCNEGRMADMLREILVERARAGIRVLFLYDAFGTSFKKEYIEALEAAGVRTAKFRPMSVFAAHKLQHRAHVRVVCIDGTVGWTGGFGIDDKWFGGGRQTDEWRDSNVRFTGPAVRQLQATFAACWAETTGDLLVGERLFPQVGDQLPGGIVAGVLHGTPAVGSTDAERFLALSIAAARTRLWLTNSYFVPDEDFRGLLCAAAGRGVDVRILTTGDATDIKTTLLAGRAHYEQLLESGIRLFEYTPTMMHAKTLVVDGVWCAVGSMNADNRSLSFNEESMLLALDAGLATLLERHFEEDMAHSEEIHLETFRQRGPWERTKERLAHQVRRVL